MKLDENEEKYEHKIKDKIKNANLNKIINKRMKEEKKEEIHGKGRRSYQEKKEKLEIYSIHNSQR